MGTIPGQNANQTIRCMICGRENAVDRKFCENCKQRLHDPTLDRLRAALEAAQDENQQLRQQLEPMQTENLELRQKHASAQDENQQLRQQLEPMQTENLELRQKHASAQDENQQLRQQLDPLKEEVARLKATSINPEHVAVLTTSLQEAEQKAADLASHAAGWQSKWKDAEEKAAALEAKLAAKVKEVEEIVKRNGGTKPIPYLKTIVGFITLLGSLAGYGTGRYVQPKDNASGRINQLVAQVTNAQKQIVDLNSALKAANDKSDQVQNQSSTDLDAANKKIGDLTTQQQQVQHQLKDAAQKVSAADQTQKQLRADLDAANHKISDLTTREQQLQHQLAEAKAQKTSADEIGTQLNAEIAKIRSQFAPRGSLVWSGNLTGKRTIDIKNGVPNFGALSGALPQKPCKVSTQDARVKIKNRPSKSHLNDLSFEVSGSGPVQVRIDWEISQ